MTTIKLGSYDNTAADAALRRIAASASAVRVPFYHFRTQAGADAYVEMSAWTGVLRLSAIWIDPKGRERGAASKLLNSILRIADEEVAELSLGVEPFGPADERKLNQGQLVCWYQRCGFVWRSVGASEMRRLPRTKRD